MRPKHTETYKKHCLARDSRRPQKHHGIWGYRREYSMGKDMMDNNHDKNHENIQQPMAMALKYSI